MSDFGDEFTFKSTIQAVLDFSFSGEDCGLKYGVMTAFMWELSGLFA